MDAIVHAVNKGLWEGGGAALPAKYIIHAVGPRRSGGEWNEPKLPYSAYEGSLLLVKEKDCHLCN